MDYLTVKEALYALADGKSLENDDGIEVLIDENCLIQRYTMGKNNELVTQNYVGTLDCLFLSRLAEVPNASE